MKKWLTKVRCFIFGHNMVDAGRFDNGCSVWGRKQCMQCGHEYDWQFDYDNYGGHETRPY